jgi:hypothetical protein
MSRITKGLLGPAVQKTAFAKIAKGGGLGSKGTWPRTVVDRDWRPFGPAHTGGPPMHNRIDIDHRHSLTISREIGERLQSSLRVGPELPPSIRNQIERLRELEGQSPSVVPTMEHDAGNNDERSVGTRLSWWRRKNNEHWRSYTARRTERKRGP